MIRGISPFPLWFSFIQNLLKVYGGDATGHGMRAGTMVTSSKNLFSSYADQDELTLKAHH